MYWIKYFSPFGITFPFFPSKPFFLFLFIIFSFSHCCVLWKLFPRFFSILCRRFLREKSWIILTICYLFFLTTGRERESKNILYVFQDGEEFFIVFEVFKGIWGKVISFIFSGLIKNKKVMMNLIFIETKGKSLCVDTLLFAV